jgi:antitoxin ParD1/3/4
MGAIAMTTLTISLPDSLKEFIDREVEAKGYGNVSEYVRGLLREARAAEADARLEALLIEGLARGEDIPASSKFWRELRRDAANVLAKQKRPGKARAGSRKLA